MIRFLYSTSVLMAFFCATPVMAAQERDPFMPRILEMFGSNDTENTQIVGVGRQDYSDPLRRAPLKAYRVVGLMISDKKSVAVMKSSEGHDYMVNKGDVVGKEGGTIQAIEMGGIAVSLNEQVIHMAVSNKMEAGK